MTFMDYPIKVTSFMDDPHLRMSESRAVINSDAHFKGISYSKREKGRQQQQQQQYKHRI